MSDVSDLAGESAERHRVWDSCFSANFSYIHGGPTRESVKARYRQWITHKLSSWEDQFGMLGCVGCGRCITWCPAGIDITEEAAALGRMSGLGSTASAAMT
jgi:ferredoxin